MSGLRTIVIGFGQVAAGLADDGRMGEHFAYASHAQVLSDHPAFEWLGVADPIEDARLAARARWGVPHVAPSVSDIASAVQPDVAIITSPPETRAEIIQQLPGLKAVLVEKPLGLGGADSEAFIAFCETQKIPVLVNYWRRADQLYQELAVGRLHALIGRPQAAFGTYGNGLYNNGCHLIDLATMLLGEVSMVQALADTRALDESPLNGDLEVPFALTMADNTVVTAQPLNFEHYREIGLDIWGEAGRLALMQESLTATHYPLAPNRGLEDAMEVASDDPHPIEITSGQALYRMYDNLAAVAVGKGSPWTPGKTAVETERIIETILTSADQGGERFYFR